MNDIIINLSYREKVESLWLVAQTASMKCEFSDTNANLNQKKQRLMIQTVNSQ